MMTVLKPADALQLREAVAWAAAEEEPVEVVGGGSKAALGRPLDVEHRLEVSALTGIGLYEPEELVMSAAAGTPLREIEARLGERCQQLAFEPADYGPLLGGAQGEGTIAGVFACNLSGPRRIKAGAARDHLLGFRAVSGRGEAFKAGGRVIKNVTGYDMCKLLTGAFGTLAVLSEVTFKVLPAAEAARTVLGFGLDDQAALAAMTRAVGGPFDVTGAAHLPGPLAALSFVGAVAGAGRAVTAVRIEGPGPSVRYRAERLASAMGESGPVAELDGEDSRAFWREVRDVAPFAADRDRHVWRLSVTPSAAAKVVREVSGALDALGFYDWGGGLIWLAVAPAGDGAQGAQTAERVVRGALARAGGHALLVRAPEAARAAVPVFQPQPEPLARLTARIKEGFDPHRVLNPGRMYEGV
jgi:glycolate oxidase FAD binding subunit